jgi:hypothetical protein
MFCAPGELQNVFDVGQARAYGHGCNGDGAALYHAVSVFVGCEKDAASNGEFHNFGLGHLLIPGLTVAHGVCRIGLAPVLAVLIG